MKVYALWFFFSYTFSKLHPSDPVLLQNFVTLVPDHLGPFFWQHVSNVRLGSLPSTQTESLI